jgi:hypothetical protein
MGRIATAAAMALAVAAAACGGSSGGSGSSGTTPPRPGAIAGVYLRHDAAHPHGGRPAGGVRIGLYRRPITFGGPVLVNPPRPIRVVRTGEGGTFAFTGLDARRYFVAAIDNRAYAVGRWARPGTRIILTGCTDCVRPL